ncbi:MAG TPA: hypothetical protein VMX55_11935 [candidate division Zixibacteria bacterium]|nr:hypothetical protein [candidate division Zixibacteria bacterium]
MVHSENSSNDEYFAVINNQRILRGEMNYALPLETYRIINIDKSTVTFDITKKEFNVLLQQQRTSESLRAKAVKFGS